MATDPKKQQEDVKKLEASWVSLYGRTEAIQQQLTKNLDQIIGSQSQSVKIQQDLVKAQELSLKANKLGNRELKSEADLLAAALKMEQERARVQDKVNAQFSAANKLAGDLVDNAQSYVKALPGGDMINKMLGLDKVGEMMEAGFNNAAKVFITSGGSMSAAMSAFNAVVMMNPLLLVVAAGVALVALLAQMTKQYKEQAKTAGVSLTVAKQQVNAAKEAVATSGSQLATSKDVLAVQNEINKSFGTSMAVSATTAAHTADIGEAMGYGAEQAAKSSASFMALGASAEEAAEVQMAANVMSVKAGVDMGAVQKDIAENAGKVSKYFSGNPEALAKAAVEAQKLGMSLDKMAKISDGLLDIESSLQAQMEFQAFTGKQVNMEKARQLALEGDIAGATKEVMKQVGDINEFENMNMKQREKLAKMTGMEVGDLEKSLRLQEFRGKLTEEELAKAQGLNLSAAELKNITAADLKQKMISQQSTEKMAASFAAVKDQIMLALAPLMEIVGFVLQLISPILKIGMMISKVLLSPLQLVFGVLNSFMGALQPIMDIFDELGTALGGSGGLGDVFKIIGDVIGTVIFTPLKLIANLLKMVLMPVIHAISGIFTFIGDTITAIGDAIQTYILGPIDSAMNAIGNLNPLNWFGGDDEEEGQAMAEGGIASGGATLVGEMGPELVNMPKGATVNTAASSEGIFGRLGNALGSALGGGGSDDTAVVAVLEQILVAVRQPAPVVIGDGQVAQIGSKIAAQNTFKKT